MKIEKFKKPALIVWSILILVLTCVPMPDYAGEKETYYDKIAHIFLFGIFAYLFFYNLSFKNQAKKIVLSFIVAISFSLMIEFFQTFVPGRDANELDFVAGVLGIGLFLVLVFFKERKIRG